jgi:hypothetical protein
MKGIVPVAPSSPEATAVMYVLPENTPETQPLELIDKKKALVSGFDELSTVPRTDPKQEPAAAPLPGSLVFVGASADVRDDAVPDSLVAETLRTPPVDFEDGPTTARSNDVVPVQTESAPRAIPMPVLPKVTPTLSQILIAHERATKKNYWLPAVGLGVAALLGVATTLLFRNFASEPEVAVRASSVPVAPPAPSSPSASPSEAATVASSAPAAPIVATPEVAPKPALSSPPSTLTGRSEPPTRRATTPGRTPTPAPAGKNGLLTVICTPACDDVIDGARSLGPSPVFKMSVAVGTHRLTLVSSDPPARKTVSVNVNEEDTAVVRETLGAGN